MRNFKFEDKLHKIIVKLLKKDKKKYEIILKKVDEIINCFDINHYKNLKSPMSEFKRVHIDNSFVLIFKYDIISNTVIFYDLDHHDKIYLK